MEERLVSVARVEARAARRAYHLKGTHAPTHKGFPPNACADVVAHMGRACKLLSEDRVYLLESVVPIPCDDAKPAQFSCFPVALNFTDIDYALDYLIEPQAQQN